MVKNTGDIKKKKYAQAIIELAVFASVLFFLIGGIATNYVNSSFQQNSQLQAMRQAMLMSYRASENVGADIATANRSSASYLVYEDRLTGEFGRYNIDRSPIVASGNGMMTFSAMRTQDWPPGDYWDTDDQPGESDDHWEDNAAAARVEQSNLPVVDVVINGKRFEFRMAGFVQYIFLARPGLLSQIPINYHQVDTSGLLVVRSNPNALYDGGEHATPLSIAPCTTASMSSNCSGGAIGGMCTDQTGDWVKYFCGMEEDATKRLAFEWAKYPGNNSDGCHMGDTLGMDPPDYPPFYTSIVGVDSRFSDCAANSCAYDYNRNGIYGSPDDMGRYPYGWYWCWAWDKLEDVRKKIDYEGGVFPAYDIDGDRLEETIYSLEGLTSTTTPPLPSGFSAGYTAQVLDPKAGDVDMNLDPANIPNIDDRQGMRPDMFIYAQTQCGDTSTTCTGTEADDITYFDVKEGKQYSASNNQPLSISTIKKNTLDVVLRIYQLNPYMIDPDGFYCHNGVPGTTMPAIAPATMAVKCACDDDPESPTVCSNATGSVDVVCTTNPAPDPIGGGCCFNTGIDPQITVKTCFDTSTKTLFIRSVINDKRAHKWITAADQQWRESLGTP